MKGLEVASTLKLVLGISLKWPLPQFVFLKTCDWASSAGLLSLCGSRRREDLFS